MLAGGVGYIFRGLSVSVCGTTHEMICNKTKLNFQDNAKLIFCVFLLETGYTLYAFGKDDVKPLEFWPL